MRPQSDWALDHLWENNLGAPGPGATAEPLDLSQSEPLQNVCGHQGWGFGV